MGRLSSYLFGLTLVAASLVSDAHAQDEECVTYNCFGIFCTREWKPKGTACSSHGECDGQGSCVEKDPCGNGTWDFGRGEECDASSAEWKESAGACDSSCKLTRKVYGSCPKGGETCWDGGIGWFCSALGACTRLCNSDADCGGGGWCVPDPIDSSQRLCALSTNHCGPGTSPQWVGRQGCFEPSTDGECKGAPRPSQLCGWVSADPTTRKLWCPAESAPCCAPEELGGEGSSSMCIK